MRAFLGYYIHTEGFGSYEIHSATYLFTVYITVSRTELFITSGDGLNLKETTWT